MSETSVNLSDPMSSAEFAAVDMERLAEIASRHQRVAGFLRQEGFAALLVQKPWNFSWLTAGASNERGGETGLTGALFVTPEARVIVCSNADTAQFFELEVPNMGFQLKERSWTEPRSVMIADLCRGRRVASDSDIPGTTNVSKQLVDLRLPLGAFDCEHMRAAGKLLAHAVEATARGLSKGRIELEVAGELSHRLLKKGLHPERIQILADGRGLRFRSWAFNDSPIQSYCTISAVARYRGLHLGVARTVCFGDPSAELLKSFEPAALVEATGICFSQPDWELSDVWSRVHRIYEKTGTASEWRLAEQADFVEYQFGSVPVIPTSSYRLSVGTPVYWHPSIGPVQMGDTILTSDRGIEILSMTREWPVVPIRVKTTTVEIPAILIVKS